MIAVGSKVLVKKLAGPVKTQGGLYMPESAKESNISKGTVIDVGEYAVEDGVKVDVFFGEGDTIAYFTKSAANVEGDIYVVDYKNVIYFERNDI